VGKPGAFDYGRVERIVLVGSGVLSLVLIVVLDHPFLGLVPILPMIVVAIRQQRRFNEARQEAISRLKHDAEAMSPSERAQALTAFRTRFHSQWTPEFRRLRRDLQAMPGGLGNPDDHDKTSPMH
jgi:hypothetical protein